MGISYRCYIFPENGPLRRIPQRIVDRLSGGEDGLPELAETRQRVLTAWLHVEDRQPQRIYRVDAEIWQFGEEGRIHESLREAVREAIDLTTEEKRSSEEGQVIDIGATLRRKRFARLYRWEPTKEDLDAVAADIWPNGAAPKVSLVEGKLPKKPPLTYDARSALDKIEEQLTRIRWAIGDLKDPALKGLAFEARARGQKKESLAPLWAGLADVLDRELRINSQHRSGKGTWYASIDIIRWDARHRCGESIGGDEERCEGRSEAEKAARRLLVEHSGSLHADTTIEARILTELEWEDPGS